MFREKRAMLLAEDGAEQCITKFYNFTKESKQHAASLIITLFDACAMYNVHHIKQSMSCMIVWKQYYSDQIDELAACVLVVLKRVRTCRRLSFFDLSR